MQTRAALRSLTDSDLFQRGILGLILCNAVALGLETTPSLPDSVSDVVQAILFWSQPVFVIEILLRIFSYARLRDFFREGWNVFDFVVVILPLLVGLASLGSAARTLRVVRVLRILRVFSASKKMRSVVDDLGPALLNAVQIGAVGIVALYIMTVVGMQLFAETDPQRWSDLGAAISTTFLLCIFSGGPEIVKNAQDSFLAAHIFLAVFYLVYGLLFSLFVAEVVADQKEGVN